jgi:hypothetical protein
MREHDADVATGELDAEVNFPWLDYEPLCW